MPLFMYDEDVSAVPEVDTVRAEAEQICALLEQRLTTLSVKLASELAAGSELAADLAELIQQRDTEIREKDGVIQRYHHKILKLADSSASKEARIQEVEAKLTQCQATCNRLAQEKELLEKHNLWLDEELKEEVKNLADLRKSNMDEESRMSAKIVELEREISESTSSLRTSKERLSELEQRVSYMEKGVGDRGDRSCWDRDGRSCWDQIDLKAVFDQRCLNLINYGTKEQLQKLKGIKIERANKIIRFRPFISLNDLSEPEIDIIKKKRVEEMRLDLFENMDKHWGPSTGKQDPCISSSAASDMKAGASTSAGVSICQAPSPP